MKILRINLENIHSLAGYHSVDFTQEPLVSTGLFAITGATGAGKSSLLDGLSLALYGKTARYTEGNAKVESVMTKHQGFARAEVEFQVGTTRYRALWELKRAHKRADGNVQPALRYLYGPEDQVLAQKATEADHLIQEITGLSYSQFTRSVLLAQGDFAKFLKSDSKDRAELLESLTGTEIYSQISKAAHDRWRLTDHHRTRLQDQLNQMNLPTDQEVQGLKDQRQDLQGALEAYNQELQQLEELQAGYQAIHRAQTEVDSAKEELATLTQESQALAPEFDRLALHKKTEPFQTKLANLDQLEGQISQLSAKILTGEQELAQRKSQVMENFLAYYQELGQGITLTHNQIQGLDQERLGLEESRDQAIGELASRELEQRINQQAEALSQGLETLVQTRTRLSLEAGAWLNQAQRLSQTAKDLGYQGPDPSGSPRPGGQNLGAAGSATGGSESIASESVDSVSVGSESLGSEITPPGDPRSLDSTALIPPGVNPTALIHELSQNLTQGALEEVTWSRPGLPQDLDRIMESLQAMVNWTQERLAQAEANRRRAQDHLELAKEVAELRAYGHLLHQGEPCPLCGSLDHPKPLSTQPEPELEPSHPSLAELQNHLDQGLKDERKITQVVDQMNQGIKDLEAARPKIHHLFLEQQKSWESLQAQGDFQPWVRTQGSSTIQGLIKALQALGSDLRNLEQQKIKAQEGLAVLKDKHQTLEHQAQEYQEDLETWHQLKANLAQSWTPEEQQTLSQNLAKLQAPGSQLPEPKSDLGQTWDPRRLRTAWANFQQQQSGLNDLQSTLNERASAFQDLQTRHSDQVLELDRLLVDSTFENLNQVRSARLPASVASQLLDQEQQLGTRQTKAHTKLESAEQALIKAQQTLASHGLRALPFQELGDRLQETRRARDTGLQELGRIDQSLKAFAEHQKQFQEIQAALEEVDHEFRLRTLMKDLIGSADGNKFRTYAQSLTLDLLLHRANRHLHRLNDRYRLTRISSSTEGQDSQSTVEAREKGPGAGAGTGFGLSGLQGKQALALAIEDHHQAGVTRPVESLSGGETFLVSLALALGLSDIAGKNRNIDSLFIDEGFGSLDPETLDVALSALESLGQQQKTVGIISHVEMLKERIRVQVEVQKLSGGHSQIRVKG